MSERQFSSGEGFQPLRPPFDLWRPPAGARQQLVFLSAKPQEFLSHWNGHCSIPCVEPHEECQGHLDGLPQRWRAYAFILFQPDEVRAFWELPKETYNNLVAHIGKGNTWRGHRVQVNRANGPKAHMELHWQPQWALTTKRELPGAVDVRETLNVLYDLQDRKHQKRN